MCVCYKAALTRRKRRNMRMSADSITLLHFGVVEHSLCGVDWVTVSRILKSSLPSWQFEHSGPMTLFACLGALAWPGCPTCVW